MGGVFIGFFFHFCLLDSKAGSWRQSGGLSQPAWLFRRKASPTRGVKNPECESVQDFYFLPIHSSLFTKNAFLIFGSNK